MIQPDVSRRFLLLLLCVAVLSACDCGDDSSGRAGGDDDLVPLDDDSDDDQIDDDSDSIGEHREQPGDIGVRVLGIDNSGVRIFTTSEGKWVEEPIETGIGGIFLTRESGNYGSAAQADNPENDLIAHFDGTVWRTETPPVDLENGYFHGLEVSDEEVYVLGSSYSHSKAVDWVIYDTIISRGSDGLWVVDTLPDLKAPSFIPSWFVDTEGNVRIAGNDLFSRKGFVLRRESAGWVAEDLPALGTSWLISNGIDRFKSAPTGGYWLLANEESNQRGAILSLQDGVWEALTLPAVSANWALHEMAICADGTAYAAGSDYENQHGFVLRYDAGGWTVEEVPGLYVVEEEQDDLHHADYIVDVACDADSLPWVAVSRVPSNVINFSLISRRSGAWAEEDLPGNDGVGCERSILVDALGRVLVLVVSYENAKDLYSVGRAYSLVAGEWVETNLSFLDLNVSWAFWDVAVASDGSILVEASEIFGWPDHLLKWDGVAWTVIDPVVGSFFDIGGVVAY